MTGPLFIAVGICTYRRPHLAATLASVGAQVLPPGVALHILVADNDSTPSADAVVRQFAASHPVAITHLHAPGANVSLARNAVLAAAARFNLRHLAFLDDDEVASPGWIAALWRRRAETGAAVVLGPVQAIYRPDAPRWMVKARLHDVQPELGKDAVPKLGHTGNVLIDLAAPGLQDLRFDVARGRTGGEDTAYFGTARAKGATFAYAPEALVEEEVPQARARLSWLVRRRYRMGQTHASLSHPAPASRRGALAVLALAKAAGSIFLALPAVLTRAGRARAVMRAALHVGVVSAHLGGRRIEPYAPALSPSSRKVS